MKTGLLIFAVFIVSFTVLTGCGVSRFTEQEQIIVGDYAMSFYIDSPFTENKIRREEVDYFNFTINENLTYDVSYSMFGSEVSYSGRIKIKEHNGATVYTISLSDQYNNRDTSMVIDSAESAILTYNVGGFTPNRTIDMNVYLTK